MIRWTVECPVRSPGRVAAEAGRETRDGGFIYLLPLTKTSRRMIAAAPSFCWFSWCGKAPAPDRAAPFPRQPGQRYNTLDFLRKSCAKRGGIPPWIPPPFPGRWISRPPIAVWIPLPENTKRTALMHKGCPFSCCCAGVTDLPILTAQQHLVLPSRKHLYFRNILRLKGNP